MTALSELFQGCQILMDFSPSNDFVIAVFYVQGSSLAMSNSIRHSSILLWHIVLLFIAESKAKSTVACI